MEIQSMEREAQSQPVPQQQQQQPQQPPQQQVRRVPPPQLRVDPPEQAHPSGLDILRQMPMQVCMQCIQCAKKKELTSKLIQS